MILRDYIHEIGSAKISGQFCAKKILILMDSETRYGELTSLSCVIKSRKYHHHTDRFYNRLYNHLVAETVCARLLSFFAGPKTVQNV